MRVSACANAAMGEPVFSLAASTVCHCTFWGILNRSPRGKDAASELDDVESGDQLKVADVGRSHSVAEFQSAGPNQQIR
jgi:hypothetical protein